MDFSELIGIALALLFALSFFVSFNSNSVRVVISVFFAILFGFFLYLDLSNLLFYVLFVAIGAGLGWGVKRMYTSLKK